MKINITYWLVLSCLSASFLTRAQNRLVQEADSLFASGNFVLAATAYERVYFFSSDNAGRIRALFQRAESQKHLRNFYDAYKSLVRIQSFDVDDSMRCAANYQLAVNLYLANFFADAERFCAKNSSLPINTPEYKSSLLLHGLTLNELNRYSFARLKFNEFVASSALNGQQKDSLTRFVDQYYAAKHLPALKSLKKARRLSKVIPGAGLFYIGKSGKAFVNIGLQLLAVGYTGANIYFGNYFSAATAGWFLVRAFYTGGVNQLNDLVPLVNNQRARGFNDGFRTAFQSQLQHYGIFN